LSAGGADHPGPHERGSDQRIAQREPTLAAVDHAQGDHAQAVEDIDRGTDGQYGRGRVGLAGTAVDVDAFHRRHAVVELAIRDLKEGAGMEHVPSGNFSANSAWLQCAVLAHNLIRWAATIGVAPTDHATVARTVRMRLIAVPARLVNLAGTMTLRGPLHWPWAEWFCRRLVCLRGLQLSTA